MHRTSVGLRKFFFTKSEILLLLLKAGYLVSFCSYVFSWLDGRIRAKTSLGRIERPSLTNCFDKYVPPCLEVINKKFKKITPIPDICHIQVLCHLLDFLLKPANISQREVTKETFELFFVFCCVWAFGSCLFKDQLHDYRVEFSKWWVNEFKIVKFPSSGQVFDFVLNPKTKKFDSWKQKVTKFELDPEMPLLNTLVPTTDVACIFFFLDMLIMAGIPVMLVGAAGTGKSVILQTKFEMLSDNFIIKKCPFNFYTTSAMLQVRAVGAFRTKACDDQEPSPPSGSPGETPGEEGGEKLRPTRSTPPHLLHR